MDGVMKARTTSVSNNRPIAMVLPNWPKLMRSLTSNAIIVAAKTSPAFVTTLPVPPMARMMPVSMPAGSSSLIRATSRRL